MKVAIISSDYERYAVQACSELGLEYVVLPSDSWKITPENLEKDIHNLIESKVDLLIVQYYATHYGLELCREASKHGIESCLITSCDRRQYGGYFNAMTDVESIKQFLVAPYEIRDSILNDIEESLRQEEDRIEQTYRNAIAKLNERKQEYSEIVAIRKGHDISQD